MSMRMVGNEDMCVGAAVEATLCWARGPESHAAVGEDRSRELAARFTFRNNFNAP